MSKIFNSFCLCSIFVIQLASILQGQPVVHYSFDGCQLTDEQGNYNPAQIRQNLQCDCGIGLSSDAYYFNGSPDTMFLDNKLNDVFSSDFSLSFYYWVNPNSGSFALMSIKEGCDRDSSLIVQYLPSAQEIILEFSTNIAEGVFFRQKIDPTKCWHHLLFTREDGMYALFLDGKFIKSIQYVSPILLGPDYDFSVGYSPCVGITDQFLDGRVDEIKIYDYAIKAEDIQSELLFPDEIITADTTIFSGEQFQVVAGSSCSNNISWFPTLGVNNPSISQPILSPTETTLYEITFNHGTCQSTDEILVSVISQNDIECQNLLFPKAFTPNNDGLNDFFGISNVFVIQSLSRFEIYDRWGLKLFETFNKNDVWDGNYKGVGQIPGTYVYKVEYSCLNQSYKKTGSFNILK